MTPLSFEWQWNVEYFFFMGFLYLALLVVGCGLAFTYIKTWIDLTPKDEAEAPGSKLPQRAKYSQY